MLRDSIFDRSNYQQVYTLYNISEKTGIKIANRQTMKLK
jgi:hypothetical protein